MTAAQGTTVNCPSMMHLYLHRPHITVSHCTPVYIPSEIIQVCWLDVQPGWIFSSTMPCSLLIDQCITWGELNWQRQALCWQPVLLRSVAQLQAVQSCLFKWHSTLMPFRTKDFILCSSFKCVDCELLPAAQQMHVHMYSSNYAPQNCKANKA